MNRHLARIMVELVRAYRSPSPARSGVFGAHRVESELITRGLP
jgi:hypothetical protein